MIYLSSGIFPWYSKWFLKKTNWRSVRSYSFAINLFKRLRVSDSHSRVFSPSVLFMQGLFANLNDLVVVANMTLCFSRAVLKGFSVMLHIFVSWMSSSDSNWLIKLIGFLSSQKHRNCFFFRTKYRYFS